MKIAVIILSLLLFLAICALLFYRKLILIILNRALEIKDKLNNTLIANGLPPLEQDILNAFEDCIVLAEVRSSEDNNYGRIFDLSKYKSHNTIGIIFFAPEDFVKKNRAELIKNLQDFILEQTLTIEEVEEILDDTELSGVVFPHCSVYQLKDGKWLWYPMEV